MRTMVLEDVYLQNFFFWLGKMSGFIPAPWFVHGIWFQGLNSMGFTMFSYVFHGRYKYGNMVLMGFTNQLSWRGKHTVLQKKLHTTTLLISMHMSKITHNHLGSLSTMLIADGL